MQNQIAQNKIRSWLVMVVFVLFVGVIGWIFAKFAGNPNMLVMVVIGALIYTVIMYFAGSRISLAINGAHEVSAEENPRLYRIVQELAMAENLPMPKVYVMDEPAPNAFATGRNPSHAAVCATSGILEIMDDNELKGVFAHEMGHVKNYDIRVSMIAAALAMVISFIADMILQMTWFRGSNERDTSPWEYALAIGAAILAPFVAMLIQLAVTRRREYLADATGAYETRHPEYLASALEKIAQYGSATQRQNTATAHLFFANPLRGRGLVNLFSTHPPLEDRIRRLREMAAGA